MPGQRIYYVPPRLVGPVQKWSGLAAADGGSWLVDHVAELGFNALWFSPLSETTKVEKTSHGQKLTGSYYAIRDHFKMDAEFSSGDPAEDIKHMKHFCAKAAEKGIRVYADLVFNHIAADHPLVTAEDNAIKDILRDTGGKVRHIRGHKNNLIGMSYFKGTEEKTFYFKFRRRDDFSLHIGGSAEDPWSDVAPINYSSPEARRFFIEGDQNDKAYFKQVLDAYLDCGFTGFRCDVAYMVPPESWQELISYERQREPDCVFMAETLGGPLDKVERLAKAVVKDPNGQQRPAFDLGMLGMYWWNMKERWLPDEENPRAQRMSKYGGAGAPDTHDTDGTIAGNFKKAFNGNSRADEIVAQICMRNYAVSALACNSHYSQMGYEYCKEKQNGVFRGMVTPNDWDVLCKDRAGKGRALDISQQIRAINELKRDLHVENCRAVFKECSERQNGRLIKMRCEYIDVDTNKKTAEVVLVLNKNPEFGPVTATDPDLRALEKGGLEKLNVLEGIVAVYHTPFKDIPGYKPNPAPAVSAGKIQPPKRAFGP